ncbi:hypothetical protein PTMSG1_05339 [Pyrenophora teres f. maculata]|nr:hypothetical protein PTMSG1_05339 [Pyrenophora teres f. maculata]
MAPRKRLGINEKDAGAHKIPADDFRRYWVSAEAFSPRNANPAVAANQHDNGFNHLNITVTPFLADLDPPKPPAFDSFTPEEETAYLVLLATKLRFAKAYMLKERELGLSPYRPHNNREAAAMELAKPPIILDMHAQHVLRLLLDMEAELRRLAAGANGEELEEKLILEPGGNYLLFWEMLKASLVWQVPGRSVKDQAETAESVMVDVLEKVVEP